MEKRQCTYHGFIIILRIIHLQSHKQISTNLLAIILPPGGMRDGFNYFRAFPQDAIQNENYSKTKLTMPVLAVGAGYIPAFGGNVTINYAFYGMQKLAQNATGIKVPNSGHWIPEERPDFVIKLLDNFFGSNITKSSKMSTIT
jgi:pimeloyl-ACP methyl ester carboxylesterase